MDEIKKKIDQIKSLDKFFEKFEKSKFHKTSTINSNYANICGIYIGSIWSNSQLTSPIETSMRIIANEQEKMNEMINADNRLLDRMMRGGGRALLKKYLLKDEFENDKEYINRVAKKINEQHSEILKDAKLLYNIIGPYVKKFHKLLSVEKPLSLNDVHLGGYYANDEVYHLAIKLPHTGLDIPLYNSDASKQLFYKIPKNVAKESIGNMRKGNISINISYRIEGISNVKKGRFLFSSIDKIKNKNIKDLDKNWKKSNGPLKIAIRDVTLVDTLLEKKYSFDKTIHPIQFLRSNRISPIKVFK